MQYLYGGTILFVDLSKGKVSKEPTSSYSRDFLGGRGINTRLLYDNVMPEIQALDPANFIIFGVGPLGGTPVPSGRTEVTSKSPETNFLGSSSFGGDFGPELKFAGYDHIIITGKADKPVYLWIYNDEVEIRDASHLWGKDSFETQTIINSERGLEAKIACIGQAGENLVRFAGVQHRRGHGGGRTGMGAVMGSKNLKAIAVRGTKGISIADPGRYLAIALELEQKLMKNPLFQMWHETGMSLYLDKMYETEYPVLTGKDRVHQHDLFLKYQTGKEACFGCPIACLDIYPKEARGGGGINCTFYASPLFIVRNTNPDVVLECGLLAVRYGIDISGAMRIIAWLMELYEKGIITAEDTDGIPMEWGNREAIVGMLRKIIFREGFGDVLADGMLPAAARIGRGTIEYANHMKGLPLYEPFAPDTVIPAKGSALAMAMSSRGDTMRARAAVFVEEMELMKMLADEKTAAEDKEARLQKVKEIAGTEKAASPEEYEGKPEIVVCTEDAVIIADCLSVCTHLGTFNFCPFDEKTQAALLSAGTGIETSVEKLFEYAKRVRNLERAFCAREGMTRDHDSLPKRFMDHPLEEEPHKGWVLKSSEFEKMKSKYYTLRGWDITTGIPTRETLEQTGLGDIAQDLEKRGKLPTEA